VASSVGVHVRPLQPGDLHEALAVVDQAFRVPKVRHLVDLIRESGRFDPELSLVAADDRGVVGYVMLSSVDLIMDAGTRGVQCLSPLAVAPQRQRQGIGGTLIRHALRLADKRGEPFVVLEGDPRYYRRYGFEPAANLGIERPSGLIPEPAFQLHRLSAWTDDLRGRIQYPEAFWRAGAVGP
jgi:putative acetyltransferase